MQQPLRTRWEATERHRYLLALVLGAAVFYWTEDPLPGVVLAAVQAGWSAFFAGWWVLRIDPHPQRARACLLFQLATAAWQVAAAAFGSVLLMALVSAALGKDPNMDKFAATMLMLSGGVSLSTLLGIAALLMALGSGVRVWSHPKLRSEWEETENGQLLLREPANPLPRFNYAIFVTGTSLVLPVILLGIGLLLYGSVRANPEDVALVPTLAGFAMVFAGPVAMIFVYAGISHRIIAKHPRECWPAGSFDAMPPYILRETP
jgi:hypothetical protein